MKTAHTIVLALAAAAAGAAGLALALHSSEPATALPERPLSRIEQDAATRFAGVEPRVKLPDGRLVAPSNAEHALAIEVNLFKGMLVREEEKRDPTFKLRAEAELERRRPLRASISWEDLSGNRDLTFTVSDSADCGLSGELEERVVSEAEVARHPCLDRENLWEPGTTLTLHLEPIARAEPLWQELLRDTMKQMAAEAYLAQPAADAGA
jgi:hypothetical protein